MAKQPPPEFLTEFLELSLMAIEEAVPEVAPEDRTAIAERIMSVFFELWGGTTVYIPKNALQSNEGRDQAIFDAYDGTTESIRLLARRHGLSTIHIYRILAAERGRRREERKRASAVASVQNGLIRG